MKNINPPQTKLLTEAIFHSPTWGELSFGQVVERLKKYLGEQAGVYRLIVGTDSAPRNGEHTEYITALIIHRVGFGGIYFWEKTVRPRSPTLRSRIYQEAMISLDFAKVLVETLLEADLLAPDLEIHVDVGQVGPTREVIAEVVGLIRGNGFEVKTKPDSFGASKVADRHT